MFSDIRCLCMVIRHTLEAHTCTSLMGNMECCGPRRAFYNDHPMSPHTMMDDDKQKPTQRFFPEASPRTLTLLRGGQCLYSQRGYILTCLLFCEGRHYRTQARVVSPLFSIRVYVCDYPSNSFSLLRERTPIGSVKCKVLPCSYWKAPRIPSTLKHIREPGSYTEA